MVENRTLPRQSAKPERKPATQHEQPTILDALSRVIVDRIHATWMFLLTFPGPIRTLSVKIALLVQACNDILVFFMNGFKKPDVKPFNEETYVFQPPPGKQMRSPCPALNSLANHGYLPRDGRNLDRATMIHALQQGYNLTYIHAWFITTNGYLLVGQWKNMSLFDLCRHNGIEHNASLVHDDAKEGDEYASDEINWKLFNAMVAQSSDGGRTLTLHDIAKTRVQREKDSVIDDLHAEIARGEIGLILDIFGGPERRVSVEQLRTWWQQEQFPAGWKPPKAKQSLPHTILTSQTVKQHMAAIRKHEQDVSDDRTHDRDVSDDLVQENWLQKLCKLHMFFFERYNGQEDSNVWL